MLMRGTGQEAGLLYILAFTIHDIHIHIDIGTSGGLAHFSIHEPGV